MGNDAVMLTIDTGTGIENRNYDFHPTLTSVLARHFYFIDVISAHRQAATLQIDPNGLVSSSKSVPKSDQAGHPTVLYYS